MKGCLLVRVQPGWTGFPARSGASDQRPAALAQALPAREVLQRFPIDHFATAVAPDDQLAVDQLADRLVGVDQRQAERIGDVLLRDRDLHRRLAIEPDYRRAAGDE